MTEAWYYAAGDHYVLDDLTGFKRRASKCRQIPGGQTGNALVDRRRWEPQQPQDFVTGVPDDQTAAPLRPRQENQFMVVASFVVAHSPARSDTIQVDSTAGMAAGDQLQIMLDSGENFRAAAQAIDGNSITLSAPLPASVGLSGDPMQNSVLDLTAPTAALNWPA